jgi:hypothetical protein
MSSASARASAVNAVARAVMPPNLSSFRSPGRATWPRGRGARRVNASTAPPPRGSKCDRDRSLLDSTQVVNAVTGSNRPDTIPRALLNPFATSTPWSQAHNDLLGGGACTRFLPGTGRERPSRREPRSPTAPRMEGSGRTVMACPTTSRKPLPQPSRHPEPATAGNPDGVGPTSLTLQLAPGGLRHARHPPLPPSKGQGRPPGQASQKEGAA